MSPLACCTLCWVVGWLVYPYTELPPLLFCMGLFLLAFLCHLKAARGGFVVEVRQINNQPTTGLALLQLEPSADLSIGGGYALAGHLQPIATPKNPGGFDFVKHMQ